MKNGFLSLLFPLAFLLSSVNTIAQTCSSLSSTCEQKVLNGNFESSVIAPAQMTNQFNTFGTSGNSEVCHWEKLIGSPKLMTSTSTQGRFVSVSNNKDCIISSIQFNTKNQYKLNFKLNNPHPISNLSSFLKMDGDLTIRLFNSSYWNAVNLNLSNLKNAPNNEFQEVYHADLSSLPKDKWEGFSTCFSPNQNFDLMLIYHENGKSPIPIMFNPWVKVDDIFLQELDIELGSDIYDGCYTAGYNIGPRCVLPNVNYSWSPANAVVHPYSGNTGTAPNSTTKYTLSANFSSCNLPVLTDTKTIEMLDQNAGPDVVLGCGLANIKIGPQTVRSTSKYSWRPTKGLSNSKVANPTLIPSQINGPITYYLSIDNCDDVDEVKVSILDADAGIDKNSDCPVVLGPSSPIVGASYNWTPAHLFDNPSVPNPIFYNPGTHTCTLTVSIPGTNCSFQDYVTVTSNSSTTYDYLIAANESVNWIKNNISNQQNVITGKSILFKGDFTFDQNFTFTNCDLYLAESSNIKVTNGKTLRIDNNSSIQSCNSDLFWQAIEVDGSSNSKVEIIQSNVSNGYQGISLLDGATATITSVAFNRNHRSISMLNTTTNGRKSSSGFNLSGSTFQCNSPLIDKYGNGYYPQTSILLDYNNSHPVPIGNNNLLANVFYGTGGGLKSIESSVTFQNCIFRGFNNTLNQHSHPVREKAIFLQGHLDDAFLNYTSVFKRYITIENCEFIENMVSIESKDFLYAEFDIKSNKVNINTQSNLIHRLILNSSFLKLMNSPVSEVSITRNEIYNTTRGIEVYDISEVNVIDNYLDMEYQRFYLYSSKNNVSSIGVYINNLESYNSTVGDNFGVKIRQNEIHHTKNGIWTEAAHALIEKNKVFNLNNNFNYPSPCIGCISQDAFGIHAANNHVNVISNKVINEPERYSDENPANDVRLNGVRISATNINSITTPSVVICNVTKNLGSGFLFWSNHHIKTKFEANSMENHIYGLVLNHGKIGDFGSSKQGSQNIWKGNFSSANTYTINVSNNFNSKIYVENHSPLLIPTINLSNNGNPFQIRNTPFVSSYQCKNWVYEFYGYEWANERTTSNELLNDVKLKSSPIKNNHQISQNDFKIDFPEGQTFIHTALQNMQKLTNEELYGMAKSCPYEKGAEVYLARRVLFKNGGPLIVSDCERVTPQTQSRSKEIVDDYKTESYNVEVYPNPSMGIVKIKLANYENTFYHFELHSTDGRGVFEKRLLNEWLQSINLEFLPAGIYFYKLLDPNQKVFKKGKLIIR